MKIASIALKDFRIYEDSGLIEFDEPLSILRGANHQGKTSIAHGIQLSLSKRADGTDPRGAGANDKIRIGGNKAILDLKLETKQGTVDIKTTYGPNRTGRQQSLSTPAFERFLDANSERLSCVLDSAYFVTLKPELQKAVLAALVLPTSYEFDAAKREIAEKHLGRFDWSGNPVAVIDQAYQAAYGARREAKAAANSIVIPSAPPKPEHSVQQIQDELAKLRASAAKETKKLKGGGSTQVARLEQSIESKNEILADAQAACTAARQREIPQLGELDGPALTTHRKVAAGRKVYGELQDKIDEQTGEVGAQEQAIEIYQELRQNPYCPTCTQSITDTFIDGKIAEHQRMMDEAAAAKARLVLEQEALGNIDEAETALRQHEQAVQRKLDAVKQVAAALDKVNKIEAEIRSITAELEKAKAEEGAPPDTAKLDEINLKVAQWEEALSPAARYEATIQQIADNTKRREEQDAKVSDLEVLCDYFGKDGVKAKLIQENIEVFEQTVNGVLGTWGYEAKLTIEPYEFMVTCANGATLPLKELSGSEQMMFGVALQCAIAVHAKLRMVLIDRADTFINGERGRLFTCLKTLLDEQILDQAIVLVSDDRTNVPEQEGVGFYRVAGGKVERLGERAGQRETAAA